MAQFLQVTISGLATGAIFAIAAVGFALLWQTAGAVNFAHGEFVMLPAVLILTLGTLEPTIGIPDFVPLIGGANVGFALPAAGVPWGLLIGAALTIPIVIFLLGYVFKKVLVDRLLEVGGDDIPLVIATIGLALFMREYVRCLLYTSPSPRDRGLSRMPSSA